MPTPTYFCSPLDQYNYVACNFTRTCGTVVCLNGGKEGSHEKILKGTLTLALSKFMHHVYCKQYFMYRKFKGKTLSLTLPRLSAFSEIHVSYINFELNHAPIAFQCWLPFGKPSQAASNYIHTP